MDNCVQVVGVVKGTSQKGSPYTVIHILSEFDDYMQSKGAEGSKAENIYILGNIDVVPGQRVELVYGVGYGGKAIVKDVVVIGD